MAVEFTDGLTTVAFVAMDEGEESDNVATVAFVVVRGGEEAETIFIPRKRNQHDVKMFAVTVANVKCSHCNIFTLTVVFHVVRKMLCYLSLLSHFLC